MNPPLSTKIDALIQVAGRLKRPVTWYEPESVKQRRTEFVLESLIAAAPRRSRREVEEARKAKR
jgi:hypothetical protein